MNVGTAASRNLPAARFLEEMRTSCHSKLVDDRIHLYGGNFQLHLTLLVSHLEIK